MTFAIFFHEQWYWCKTCGYAFPASEVGAHKGHVYWPTTGTSE